MASESDVLVPPINYAMLCPGVHRSGYPNKKSFPFLKSLKLKTILFLCPESYAEANVDFCNANGITLRNVQMQGNKEPFVDIPEEQMNEALSIVTDARNHPLLIHCNKGKHRTGAVCGCLRRLQGWCLTSTFQEYVRFAGDKARGGDQQFIELYVPVVRHVSMHHVARWVAMTQHVLLVEAPPVVDGTADAEPDAASAAAAVAKA